jgi:hypothetical protein
MQDNFELFLWKTVPVRSTCVEGREQEVVLATRLELLVSCGIPESLAPVLSEFSVAHIGRNSLAYVCKCGPGDRGYEVQLLRSARISFVGHFSAQPKAEQPRSPALSEIGGGLGFEKSTGIDSNEAGYGIVLKWFLVNC